MASLPTPGMAGACDARAGATILGNGEPHLEQTALPTGLSVPQLSHLTIFIWGGGACISRPDSRALPSSRSPPHCEQVLAVAGLRVPQNGQWISAPAPAALTDSASLMIFCSAGSSNCTFSGCGAPQFAHVFTLPLLRVWQFGQVHSFSI